MRTIKIMAVAATLLVATAGFALACDGNKTSSAKAETASTVKAETASTSGCSSSAKAETASATKTAKADCSTSASATKTASAGCSTSASAIKTAGAGCSTGATAIKTAGAGCSSTAGATKTAHAIKLETVRMPSGTLAVFYHGKNAESVAMLQGSVEGGVDSFGCSLAKGAAENCKTEMAKTETGMMILVSAEKAEAIDQVEETYAVAMASMNTETDSE